MVTAAYQIFEYEFLIYVEFAFYFTDETTHVHAACMMQVYVEYILGIVREILHFENHLFNRQDFIRYQPTFLPLCSKKNS